MELWDVLDDKGNLTGRTIERGKKLNDGEYHLVVNIWIKDSNNRYLIQKRAESLKLLPGIWASTGGSAISGETSREAAVREAKEEIGLDIEKYTLMQIARIKRKNAFHDIWLVKADVHIDELRLQEEEVSDVKYFSKEEIQQMISEGVFFDYGSDYFELLYKY